MKPLFRNLDFLIARVVGNYSARFPGCSIAQFVDVKTNRYNRSVVSLVLSALDNDGLTLHCCTVYLDTVNKALYPNIVEWAINRNLIYN